MDLPSALQTPAYPLLSGDDGDRWKHSALRYRLLRGIHRADVVKAIADHVDPTRQRQWGVPDLSSNVLKSITTQLAVIHDRGPIWGHTQQKPPAQLLGEGGFYDRAGWAPLMSRFSVNVIGMREAAMHHSIVAKPGASADDAKLLFRPVMPHQLVCCSEASDPENPYRVQEARLRKNPESGKPEWTWDVYDIEGEPYYGVFACKPDGGVGDDLSRMHLPETGLVRGDAYLETWSSIGGDPFIPYELYHAAKTGNLWDAYDGIEVCEGSITAAVLWTFFVHCIRDASWPQRYAVGLQLLGAPLKNDSQDTVQFSVPTDPSSILMFRAISEAQGMLGQFQPAADPEKLQIAIAEYEGRVAEYYGVSPADLQRTGGNARSGYAISISNSGKREAQRRFAPQFRVGDCASAALSAKLLNRRFALNLPERDYTIEYQAIPLSDQELEARRRDILEQVDAGLMSEIDAYMELHPGVSHDGAVRALVRVETDKLLLAQERALVAEKMGVKPKLSPSPSPSPESDPTKPPDPGAQPTAQAPEDQQNAA